MAQKSPDQHDQMNLFGAALVTIIVGTVVWVLVISLAIAVIVLWP